MKRHFASYLPKGFFDTTHVWHAFLLGMVYLMLLIAQLFTFEDFPVVVRTWGLPGGDIAIGLVVVLIPLLEALSLPYLISMRLSRALRTISRWTVVGVALLWTMISIWLVTRPIISDSGFFGATISLPSGLWMIFYSALLFIGALVVTSEKD